MCQAECGVSVGKHEQPEEFDWKGAAPVCMQPHQCAAISCRGQRNGRRASDFLAQQQIVGCKAIISNTLDHQLQTNAPSDACQPGASYGAERGAEFVVRDPPCYLVLGAKSPGQWKCM